MIHDINTNLNDCPMLARHIQISQLSNDMALALRGMRQDLRYCGACTLKPQECRLLVDLNQAVSTAIEEITREWGLVRKNQRDLP
jgi:hypothetical protein